MDVDKHFLIEGVVYDCSKLHPAHSGPDQVTLYCAGKQVWRGITMEYKMYEVRDGEIYRESSLRPHSYENVTISEIEIQ